MLRKFLVVLSIASMQMPVQVWSGDAPFIDVGQTSPNTNRIAQLKQAFLLLNRPIDVSTFVEQPSTSALYDNSVAYVTIGGDGKRFLESAPTLDLCYALWPFLENPQYDADSALMLFCKLHERIIARYELTQNSQSVANYWPTERAGIIKRCKRLCQVALHQPDWWYPHQVLFDREKVLAESKDNRVARASYIAAMQKALADPNIRTENPLGVEETISLLSALNARNSASTLVSYLLFDKTTGMDFRLSSVSQLTRGILGNDKPPFVGYLPWLKREPLSLIFKRIADATPEEMSCEVGGGAIPYFMIDYFWIIDVSEKDAIDLINGYIHTCPDLSGKQCANLVIIIDAIRTKKYRPFFMKGSDWAAPIATNAPPTKP